MAAGAMVCSSLCVMGSSLFLKRYRKPDVITDADMLDTEVAAEVYSKMHRWNLSRSHFILKWRALLVVVLALGAVFVVLLSLSVVYGVLYSQIPTPVPFLPSKISLTTSNGPLTSGQDNKLILTLKNVDDTPITLAQLEQEHLRFLHVVIVGNDFDSLGHIHPEDFPDGFDLESQGSYVVHFNFPRSGTYLISATFSTPKGDGAKHLWVSVAGSSPMNTYTKDTTTTKSFKLFDAYNGSMPTPFVLSQCQTTPNDPNGLTVAMTAPSTIFNGVSTNFLFNFTDSTGAPFPGIRLFLDAAVHVVIVREGLSSFDHMHGQSLTQAQNSGSSGGHSHRDGDGVAAVAPGPDDLGPVLEVSLEFPMEGWYILVGQTATAAGKVINFGFMLLVQ